CSPEPAALPISCIAPLTLGPGASSVHRVTVIIPAGGPLARIAEPLSAENCVGVVPPGAPVANAERIKSTAPGTGGRPGTRPYACHAFTIADRVEACAPGFVMNDAGRCVCPEGTTFRNGQCRKAGGEPPPVPPVKECKLLPGQIRLGDGRCVCPRGTSLIRGACRKEQADRCPRGTIGTPPNCRRLQISPDLQRLIAPTQRRRQPASRFFASGDAQYCAHYSLDIYVWNA
ncbi:MAG TPA: hypothetical protein VIZ90_08630, partial [Rhizobiaceae bacterium]